MGAAVAKAQEDLANAPRTLAEVRLAVAAETLLQWDRSPDAGIWGADASCTNSNRILLSAVDEILHLKEVCAFPLASPARRRMDGALGVAMPRLMEEFLFLRVWDASQLRGASGLRFAADKLSVSVASAPVSLAFPTSGSTSTKSTTGGRSTSTTSDDLYAPGGLSSRPDAPAVSTAKSSDELHLICPASLPVLHEIARRVIRAGYAEDLLRAFTRAPCDVLDRFLSVLRVECSSQTTEIVIKRWTLVTKLIEKTVAVMQTQLRAHSLGAFESFKEEYLLAVTESRILILLEFADEFTGITSHEKLVYMLCVYEALIDAAPSLLFMFSGARKDLVSEKMQNILSKLANAMKTMVSSLMDKIRSGCSPAPSAADGVHPLARYAMICVEQLAAHRTTLDMVLANGDGDGSGALAGGAERVSSAGGLVSELIAALELNLVEKLAPACTHAGGVPHLFLANNISFVLNRAADAGVVSLLGDYEWAARRRSRLERHVASYVEDSWRPVVACLAPAVGGGGKPAKALAEFSAAFKKAHGSHVCREVPDPTLRAALRKAVSETVVPVYVAFLKKHPKLGESIRYTADNLDESVSELFEGEAADSRTRKL